MGVCEITTTPREITHALPAWLCTTTQYSPIGTSGTMNVTVTRHP